MIWAALPFPLPASLLLSPLLFSSSPLPHLFLSSSSSLLFLSSSLLFYPLPLLFSPLPLLSSSLLFSPLSLRFLSSSSPLPLFLSSTSPLQSSSSPLLSSSLLSVSSSLFRKCFFSSGASDGFFHWDSNSNPYSENDVQLRRPRRGRGEEEEKAAQIILTQEGTQKNYSFEFPFQVSPQILSSVRRFCVSSQSLSWVAVFVPLLNVSPMCLSVSTVPLLCVSLHCLSSMSSLPLLGVSHLLHASPKYMSSVSSVALPNAFPQCSPECLSSVPLLSSVPQFLS